MKKSTNFAIGGLETTKGELKEVVNIIKEQAREKRCLESRNRRCERGGLRSEGQRGHLKICYRVYPHQKQ